MHDIWQRCLVSKGECVIPYVTRSLQRPAQPSEYQGLGTPVAVQQVGTCFQCHRRKESGSPEHLHTPI